MKSYFAYKGTKGSTQFQEKDRTRLEHGQNVLIKITETIGTIESKIIKTQI